MSKLEAWLSGPVEGVPPLLMPVAHALIQAVDEIERHTEDLTVEQIWSRPGGVASIGFHMRHVGGVMDRLLTYARGEQLTQEQLTALQKEGEPGEPPAEREDLLHGLRAHLEAALEQVRSTPETALLDPRGVGRKQLPSNNLGLLFHAAEHAQRHTGQIVATAGVLRGVR